ncbi:hypothetical protein BDQ17DRAFT_151323 [Cyathus striatus]|nr:hypothetical protein BDQ17DRAFT_151323 [Cyathus striatus]
MRSSVSVSPTVHHRLSLDQIHGKRIVLIFDTLTTALVGHSIYTYLVLHLGNDNQVLLDTSIPWSFALENEIVDVITCIAQTFFAYQIWQVSGRRILPIVIVLLALSALGADLEVTIHLFRVSDTSSLSDAAVQIVGSIDQGLCALCDLVITVSLVY